MGIDNVSIIIPAKNEAIGLSAILMDISKRFPNAEVIVVSDGSVDDTVKICEDCGATVIRHPYGMGNGAAIKAGARAAQGEILVFMDADGQHKPEDISRLLDKFAEGYDMVVGARSFSSQATMGRGVANTFYNRLSSWMVNQPVLDLTSGFRVAKGGLFKDFLYLLPNGFSYPTTITMAFFRAGYSVAYIPIVAASRQGKSHIRPVKDGIRFLLIIFKIGTLYSPLKLFAPISAFFFLLGLGHYIQTFLTIHRFTNMSALLFITSVLVFLIGLVSEQITTLLYREHKR